MLDALRTGPYYDDYDSKKQYTQLLAIPGRVAQAREITQIQTVLKDIIKSVGDSVLRDGNIIEGCQVVPFTENGLRKVRVTSGRVYVNGMVLPVSESVVIITGVGTETVGVRLIEEIVTEAADPTLRDPAQGYANYNQPGCNRLRSSLLVVANDSDASIIATLVDGSLAVEKYAPEYDTLTQTLARRTYDESGSYIVDGLGVRVEANTDDSQFNVVVESGKAYILGYELKIPSPRRINLPRSMDYIPVSTDYRYNSSNPGTTLASAPYVKSINSVSGLVERTVNLAAPATNTSSVSLPDTRVFEIISISGGYTFSNNPEDTSTDCTLIPEGTRYAIKWNGTSNYPRSSFTVTYSYTYTFVQGEDYKLEVDASNRHRLVWLQPTVASKHPLNSTQFNVSYELYLARKDIVYIDQDGNISVLQGTPAEYGYEILPTAPVNTLPLAYIMSPPGGSISNNSDTKITTSNVGLTRFTMNDIQAIVNRIKTLEYDQAILSLNNEARQYNTSAAKKGIYTDPLIDYSKIDLYYNLSEGIAVDDSRPIYDAAIDFNNSICYLPIITGTYDAVYNLESSSSTLHTRVATLPKTGETVQLSQMNATKSFLINPYSVYPQLPELSITPAVDTWYDDTIITVPVSTTNSSVVSTASRYVDNTVSWMNNNWNYRIRTTTSVRDTQIGTSVNVTSSDSIVSEQAVLYMRQREIDVEGANYPPDLDNIKCYFDGIECALTPTGGTQSGTNAGSVKSDTSGHFTAKFKIPENVLVGIREVRLESNIKREGYLSSAFALYQAAGTARTIQRTVTTMTTVLLQRVTTTTATNIYVDPVGQTFVLDRMTLLSGIDLYFESKPAGDIPVTCEIRAVSNGSITATIYGSKTLKASQVTVSSDSKKATRFTFDDPVLLEANTEYAFVVRSTSPNYSLWVATLGENDILSGQLVLSNPYLIGVMMSSSNNSSWTTHQTTDVKFRLISDDYSSTAEMIFDPINSEENFSRINLLAESVVPAGTSISWSYSTDGGNTYKEISPYEIEILDTMNNNVRFKANLTRGTNKNMSPLVAIDTISSVLSCYDNEGYYIMNNVSGLNDYTTVTILLETYTEKSGTAIEIYVSNDNGETMNKAELQPSETVDRNFGWEEQTYVATLTPVPSATNNQQCRVFIKMTSENKYSTPAFGKLRVIMS